VPGRQTGIAPRVVRLFADLYCDCRGYLSAWGHILRQLGECPAESPAAVRWFARWLGYEQGPALLEAALPALQDFHRQAVAPARLQAAGLPHGEALQAALLVKSVSGRLGDLTPDDLAELEQCPPDQLPRRLLRTVQQRGSGSEPPARRRPPRRQADPSVPAAAPTRGPDPDDEGALLGAGVGT
jgi:hypothetical protein